MPSSVKFAVLKVEETQSNKWLRLAEEGTRVKWNVPTDRLPEAWRKVGTEIKVSLTGP